MSTGSYQSCRPIDGRSTYDIGTIVIAESHSLSVSPDRYLVAVEMLPVSDSCRLRTLALAMAGRRLESLFPSHPQRKATQSRMIGWRGRATVSCLLSTSPYKVMFGNCKPPEGTTFVLCIAFFVSRGRAVSHYAFKTQVFAEVRKSFSRTQPG